MEMSKNGKRTNFREIMPEKIRQQNLIWDWGTASNFQGFNAHQSMKNKTIHHVS